VGTAGSPSATDRSRAAAPPTGRPAPGPLLRAWQWLRALGRVLWLTRFSVASLVIGAYALLANAQTQEVLREFAVSDGAVVDLLQYAVFAAATLLWCWNCWSWARTLTTLRLPGSAPPDGPELALRVWVPRALGGLAAFVVPLSFWLAADVYRAGNTTYYARLHWVAAAFCAGAVLFVVGIVARRHLPWFGSVEGVREAAAGVHEPSGLSGFDRLSIAATVATTLALFALFAWDAAVTAPWFGAAAILLAALSAWIPFGSALVYLSARWHRVPLFALFLLAAVAFSAGNDNHALRVQEGPAPAAADDHGDCEAVGVVPPAAGVATAPRYPLCAWGKRWLEARRGDIERASEPYPVYLVAAAGGGIRAAFWTAGVLGFRHDLDPAFAGRLFAISGVSGGSLGAQVFVGLLREQRNAAARGESWIGCGGYFEQQPVTSCATAILAGDFLAPVLGAMLYPDLVARFLPVGIPHFDRARALETGWERRWRVVMGAGGGDWLASSFELLANPDPAGAPPLLLLNATTVEQGKRAIVSPLPVTPLEFPDAFDVRALVGRPIANSTAAHLSARFMYVSPAATLEVQDAQGRAAPWGHLVDGGYFENSGTATLLDTLAALQAAARETGLAAKIRPVVMVLSNNPDAPIPADDPGADRPAPLHLLVETRAPLETMLMTREGRGTQAQAVLKRAVEWRGAGVPRGVFDHYQPARGNVPLPLGWMLSNSSRAELSRQVILSTCGPERGLRCP
jgi:hypothetical protein